MRKTYLLGLLMMTLSSVSVAQMKCADILRDTGVKLSTSGFEAERQNDAKLLPEMTLRLLQMSAKTLGESFSEKLTLEKGELSLAEDLGSGYSLEYEYFADRRSDQEAFRLGKISVIKPNGEKTLLQKNPTSADGMSLSKKRFSEEDLGMASLGENSPAGTLQNLNVPTVIQGELLTGFLTWAPRMEYLKREELRAAGPDALKGLRGRAFLRSNKDYVGKIIKKQSFKYVMFALAMYLFYSERDRALEALDSLRDPWSDIEAGTAVERMKNFYPNGADDVNETPPMALDRALRDITALVKAEKKLEAKPAFYWLDKESVTPAEDMTTVTKNIGKGLKSINEGAPENSGLLVIFPASKRVLIVTQSDSEKKPLILMGVSQTQHQKIYQSYVDLTLPQSETPAKK
jgi:hypothetical protein